MSNVVRHRGEAYDSADDIDDINDARNGLLLLISRLELVN